MESVFSQTASKPQVTAEGETIFSVSELNGLVRDRLEREFPQVWVSGEISNLSQPASGHQYFTLKDSGAQIRCAFFRHRQRGQTCVLEHGKQVVVLAKVSLYPDRGDYQLIVEQVLDSGLGALQQAFAALKDSLAKRGLFDETLKRPLPTIPKHLGIITSGTGAALQDVLSVLKRRYPALPVTVYQSQVQGESAAKELIRALTFANQQAECDVLLLTRGGGSLEDLWPFNDEQLAYAIYDSQLPVLSAVGHEIDFTIADFVADKRAPTPSAAAELLSPNRYDLTQKIDGLALRLARVLQHRLEHTRIKLAHLSRRLQHPQEKLARKHQFLDNLSYRLQQIIHNYLKSQKFELQLLQEQLNRHNPLLRLQQQQADFKDLLRSLSFAMEQQLQQKRERFQLATEKLNAFNPLRTLERGYSITQNAENGVITDAKQLSENSRVNLRFAKGSATATIVKIQD